VSAQTTTTQGLVAEHIGHHYLHSRVSTEVLRDVSLDVAPGRTLAVIGESGAGKSTLARILCGLERPTSGQVLLDGATFRLHRGRVAPVQMVFQNPVGALDPRRTIGHSIALPLRNRPRRERTARVAELLTAVGLEPKHATRRPSRLSGGQLQRVVLARALAARPRVLVCDEPTSALDVSVQAQIINLLLDLQKAEDFACIVVTHDLLVAKVLADDVLLLRHGAVVESATAATFFTAPASEYGQDLMASSVWTHLTKGGS
jgi:ABC-type glutathione transport system ATPase component